MEWTPLDQISYIYNNATSNSPLRQLFVDYAVAKACFQDDSWFGEATFHYYTKEFLLDLAIAQCKIRRGLRFIAEDFGAGKCNYHVTDAV